MGVGSGIGGLVTSFIDSEAWVLVVAIFAIILVIAVISAIKGCV